MNHLKQEVINILDKNHTGVLSTVQGNRPHARYMMFFHDGLHIYTATNKKTHKVEEIEANPNVHVLLGFEQTERHYVELDGVASFVNDESLKQKYWNELLSPWIDGPDDPNYCLLKIKPEQIELIHGKNAPTIS